MDLEIHKRMQEKSKNNTKTPEPVTSKANTTSFGKKKLNRADYMF